METAWCGHKILCISGDAANYSPGWIPAGVLGKQDCRARDQGKVLKPAQHLLSSVCATCNSLGDTGKCLK